VGCDLRVYPTPGDTDLPAVQPITRAHIAALRTVLAKHGITLPDGDTAVIEGDGVAANAVYDPVAQTLSLKVTKKGWKPCGPIMRAIREHIVEAQAAAPPAPAAHQEDGDEDNGGNAPA
jgi:hypothetical protein